MCSTQMCFCAMYLQIGYNIYAVCSRLYTGWYFCGFVVSETCHMR
jgi:hypothetical protein